MNQVVFLSEICFASYFVYYRVIKTKVLSKLTGVPPNKVQYVGDMVEPLTQSLWEFLYGR